MADEMDLEREFSASESLSVQYLPGSGGAQFFQEDARVTESILYIRLRIAGGGALPFHVHPELDEIISVLEGEMEHWIEAENQMMGPGQSTLVPRGVVHGCYNLGVAPCELLAV